MGPGLHPPTGGDKLGYQILQKLLMGGVRVTKELHMWHGTQSTPQRSKGAGGENVNLWNIAYVTKLVWAIAKKKDSLWSNGSMGDT